MRNSPPHKRGYFESMVLRALMIMLIRFANGKLSPIEQQWLIDYGSPEFEEITNAKD
jgi:hypothetical protein